jgi:ketosteroid isomerase-like protein
MSSRSEIAKEYYSAFAQGDRRFIEDHLADNFTFSAPPDPYLEHYSKPHVIEKKKSPRAASYASL